MAFDLYIRVSRRAGREGDSYRSPRDQESIGRKLAEDKGVGLAEIVAEEDVSGKVPIDRRELGRLVRKVEAGESQGLIVWQSTRFSRDFADGVAAMVRVTGAGGRIIAQDVDTGTPLGRGMMGLLMDVAEGQLDDKRAGWMRAQGGAVERGVWVGATVPVGYTKGDDGRLSVDSEIAEHVVWAFEARGRHESWRSIAAELNRRGLTQWVRDEDGTYKRQPRPMSATGLRTMITSRAYRGEIVNGVHVNVEAHEAIVDEATWQAAQPNGRRPAFNGHVAARGVLSGGLAVCAECGAPMGVGTTGNAHASYKCRAQRIERCTAPASIAVSRVDSALLPLLQERMDAKRDVATEDADVAACQAALLKAEANLDAFLQHAEPAQLGDRYGREIARYRAAINAAQAEVVALQTRLAASMFSGIGTVLAEESIDRQREVARAFVQRVTVRRSGNGAHDHADRFEITWR